MTEIEKEAEAILEEKEKFPTQVKEVLTNRIN